MGKKLLVWVIGIMAVGLFLTAVPAYGDIEAETKEFYFSTDGYDVYYSKSRYERGEKCGRVKANYITIGEKEYSFSSDEDLATGFKHIIENNGYEIDASINEKVEKEKEARRQEAEKQQQQSTSADSGGGEGGGGSSSSSSSGFGWESYYNNYKRGDYNSSGGKDVFSPIDLSGVGESAGVVIKSSLDLASLPLRMISGIFQDKRSPLQKTFDRGCQLISKERYNEALSSFQEAQRLAPEADGPYYCQGFIYEKTNKPELAIENYQKYLQLLGNQADEPYKTLAKEYIQKYNEKAIAYNKLACKYINNEDYKKAIQPLLEAQKLFPNWAGPYFNLGQVYKCLGQTELALGNYQKYLELIKEENEYTKLAQTYIQEQQKPVAEKVEIQKHQSKQEEITENQTNVPKQEIISNTEIVAGFYLAHGIDLLYTNKDLSAAYLELKQALELDPQNPNIYYHIAYIHRRNGEIGAARWCYVTALKLGLKNSSYVSSARNFLEVTSDYDKIKE